MFWFFKKISFTQLGLNIWGKASERKKNAKTKIVTIPFRIKSIKYNKKMPDFFKIEHLKEILEFFVDLKTTN